MKGRRNSMRWLYLLIILVVSTTSFSQKQVKLKRVVIDAGHGGKDSGARGKLVQEKDVVLALALKLGNYIEKYLPEVEVIYTRKTDVFIPLNDRAKIANDNNADFFISIHANYISNPKIVGTETFVLGLHRTEENLEVAKKENSVIVMEEDYTTKYEGFDPNSPESYIIFELMQNAYLDQSIEMASTVQNQFTARVGRNDRGVKQAGFLVLRKTSMPSVLIEVGFLSNKNEEKYISSADGQTYLASAMYRAFKEYKTAFEERSLLLDDETQKAINEKQNKEKNSCLFRVQIASSNEKIEAGEGPYKLFDDVWEYMDGDKYKYTTGCSSDYKEVKNYWKEVKEKVPDSFIIAFKGESRISIKQAMKEVNVN